jgi:hypothetical protein
MLYPTELQARLWSVHYAMFRVAGKQNVVPVTARACSTAELVLIIVVMELDWQQFEDECAAAVRAYDKYVVCVDKTPDDFQKSLQSLIEKAVKAYETRAPGLRHGIALDRHVTVIVSQTDEDRPLCGIYFNLHSPYRKKAA